METNIVISNFWRRILALLIDFVILGIIGFIIGMIFQDFFSNMGIYGPLFGMAIVIFYQTIFNSKVVNGQTFGKMILNIQVVDINGNTLNIDLSILRALILSVPYFTINISIPYISDISILSIIKSIILFSMVLGVIVIYIFNNKTRQSLHDLLIGSYVVSTERNEELKPIPAVNKASFYILGSLIILVIGFNIFFLTQKSELGNLNIVNNKIEQINGVIQSGVNKKTNVFYGEKKTVTKIYQANIRVSNLPDGNIENSKIVQDVVKIILRNESDIDNYDILYVSLTKGFDIGIARYSSSTNISKTPSEWRKILNI